VADYNRDQIRAALALGDPATGAVVALREGDESAAGQALADEIMASIGDRFRYISGGNPGATDADVDAWLENEGL
jgi:hypothetical protein